MEVIAIRPLADSAVTFDLDTGPGARAAGRVRAAVTAIKAEAAQGGLDGSVEAAGAFASVTVLYDPLSVAQGDLVDAVTALLAATDPAAHGAGRLWRLPCCYDGAHGADLADLSERLGLASDEIVRRHLECELHVYAMGFLPGLPFMGDLPPALSLPRRASPRARVPAGAVAIAKGLCVIYPGASPGGWHIVGHCPVPLFDAARAMPALLAPGDRVRFQQVDEARHDQIVADLAEGVSQPSHFLQEGGDGDRSNAVGRAMGE